MKSITPIPSIGSRVRQRSNYFHELEYRTWPTVDQEQRDCIGIRRSLMDEMQIYPVDHRGELIEFIKDLFLCTPIKLGSPIIY